MSTTMKSQFSYRKASSALLVGLAISVFSMQTYSGPLEQAKRIHDRLAGVPPETGGAPEDDVLNLMAAEIENGNAVGAAQIAMESDAFYNVTLKTWAAPWTNRDQDVFVALNDYIATVVGFVRDSHPNADVNQNGGAPMDFRELLFGDVIYTGRDGLAGVRAHSNNDNNHYVDIESAGYSLKDDLVQRSQSSVTGLPADATAGVVTSRAAAKAFFIAGTNRANFRFTLMNHMCMDLEQVHDITRIPDRIRQDVSRSPGGDGRVFLNNCIGCHSGMDPMAQAFAYYDYIPAAEGSDDGAISYNDVGVVDAETGTRVKAKYHFNRATFPYGYVTPDDKWDNYWREGPNSVLGWGDTPGSDDGSGTGARTMLQELAYSRAFSECQVEKVFKAVCLREPLVAADINAVDGMVNQFHADNNINTVFANSAVHCMGE